MKHVALKAPEINASIDRTVNDLKRFTVKHVHGLSNFGWEPKKSDEEFIKSLVIDACEQCLLFDVDGYMFERKNVYLDDVLKDIIEYKRGDFYTDTSLGFEVDSITEKLNEDFDDEFKSMMGKLRKNSVIEIDKSVEEDLRAYCSNQNEIVLYNVMNKFNIYKPTMEVIRKLSLNVILEYENEEEEVISIITKIDYDILKQLFLKYTSKAKLKVYFHRNVANFAKIDEVCEELLVDDCDTVVPLKALKYIKFLDDVNIESCVEMIWD